MTPACAVLPPFPSDARLFLRGRGGTRQCRLRFPCDRYAADDWAVQLVFAFDGLPVGVLHAQHEHRQRALLVELLVADLDREHADEVALAIRRLIPMLAQVPR